MTRSELMGRIRSTGNRSTELAVVRLFRRHGVPGWRRHAKVLGVRPDFVFRKTKIAMFVDGCFWHACDVHCKVSRLSAYWQTKVVGNSLRDYWQTRKLKYGGWKVVRIWEHDLRKGHEHVDMSVFK